LIDNYLKQFKLLRKPVNYEFIRKNLAKSFQQIYKGMSSLKMPTFNKPFREELEEQTPDPTQYGPDKVAKAMKIAVNSDGKYTIAVREIEKIAKNLSKVSTIARALQTANEQLEEAIAPFRLSYDDKYGKHAGFEDAKTLQDLQNKAQKLRAKGFKINKMGRNTSPVKEDFTKKDYKKLMSEIKEAMPGGANSSSRQGSFAKSRKPKYRFGYRVAEKQPTGDKLAEEAKDIAVGQRISFDQLSQSLKDLWTEAADKEKGASDAKVPAIKKDNKPGVKIAKIRLKRDKMDGPEGDGKDEGAELAKKEDEVALLKQKMETEKAKSVEKATKKLVNPETGEPLLQIGIAYKHIRDKLEKEKEKKKSEVKESTEYLKSKLSSTQIANIKATWAKKKASDVTIGVKDMIKKMDIPTQLAIKAADIPHISKLIEGLSEGKYTRYSYLLIQKGRMQKAGDKQGEKQTDIEIEKEKQKLGIKEGVEVQVIKKGSGPINKRSHVHDFKNRADAEKWIKWYKTGGSLYKKSEIEKILIHEVNDRSSLIYQYNLPQIVSEDKEGSAYAIGMAKAKEKYNDEPPLEKKTIRKAHHIADKILNNQVQNGDGMEDQPETPKKKLKIGIVHPAKETVNRLWHKRGDKK
jgi:hypothetical protein